VTKPNVPPSPLDIDEVLERLTKAVQAYKLPMVTGMVEESQGNKRGRQPFRVLIATILSARTRDEQTEKASTALFARFDSAATLAAAPLDEVEELARPVGFHKTKAVNIIKTAAALLETHGGEVPDDMDALLALPGVGRKTANLVLTLGFGSQGICVDTHVHRITNRWGYMTTKTPEETEMALRRVLPARWWIPINDLLVTWGQQICRPISPRCSECPILDACAQRGVGNHR
jgi:endonuclease III